MTTVTLGGNPLNVAHRTYDLTVYYYAPVHAALIRVFGDDVTSIPLANTLHFALMGALGLVYFVARRQWLMGVFFAAALWTDPMALEIYRTGRPEVTCGTRPSPNKRFPALLWILPV